jgi:hypothetical protein
VPACGVPVMIFARRIGRPLAVQRSHDADPHKHRRPAEIGDQNQGFHCGLPLRGGVDMLRKTDDLVAGVLTRIPPPGRAIGLVNSRAQPPLMAPALLVELDARAGRSGRVAHVARSASRARHPGAAANARMQTVGFAYRVADLAGVHVVMPRPRDVEFRTKPDILQSVDLGFGRLRVGATPFPLNDLGMPRQRPLTVVSGVPLHGTFGRILQDEGS